MPASGKNGFAMFTAEERRFVLPRRRGDRVMAFVLASVLTGFFALMHVRLEKEAVLGGLRKVLHGLAVEAMLTFCFFSALALVWALFAPRWLETLVARSLSKVFATIAAILAAAVFAILYYTL